MIHVYDAWLKKMALHNSHILPPFLNICLFRDFKWTTTYGCIQTYFRVQIHLFCSVCSHLLKSIKDKYLGMVGVHWCVSVLNKQFKTPLGDGIWNCRQVSVGDMGGPSHATQKPSGIGPLQYSYSFLLALPSQSVFYGATFMMRDPSQTVHR